MTLEAGVTYWFQNTGKVEKTTSNRRAVSRSLIRLDFSATSMRRGVGASSEDPDFSVVVTDTTVTVTSTRGRVYAEALPGTSVVKNAPCNAMPPAYGLRYDEVSPGALATITYTRGIRPTADVTLADDERLAATGNAYAEYNLGSRYEDGHAVAKDDTTALQWYRKAADQGLPDAQNKLGAMYASGRGVTRDYTAALRYYKLAAAKGFAEAQKNAGSIYDDGHGVPVNYTTALYFYREAAVQGLASAQDKIGVLYREGHGVKKNYVTALQWFH